MKHTIYRDYRGERKEKMKIEIEGEVKEKKGCDVTLKKGAKVLNEVVVRVK